MLIPKKYHIHIIALIAVAVIIFFPSLGNKPAPEVLSKGSAAADEFLQLVDAGKYVQSWQVSSPLLKKKIFLEVWNRQILAMRTKVGPLVKRSQNTASVSETAEGAPDGKYLTLKYDSSFQKQSTAIETLILSLEKNGQWRVVGYFIK